MKCDRQSKEYFMEIPDTEGASEAGIYWCEDCQKSRYHSLYFPRDGWFYQVASEEELEEAAQEPDILLCDICIRAENEND